MPGPDGLEAVLKSSIRLGKIAGVDIGIHYSWFAVLVLVSWSLSRGLLPDQFPGWQRETYWVTAVLAALALFASVLIHELAHSLVAKARGFTVDGITLFLLGGVSNLKAESRRPRDEFVISSVGPLASLALSLLFGLALSALQDGASQGAATVWFLRMLELSNSPSAAIIWYVALMNLILAGFNLLPAFPLDGGRVLRSVLWGFTGNFRSATAVAGRGGQTVGIAFIGLGALSVFQGSLLGGLWFALIGWFLHSAATASVRDSARGEEFRGVRVGDVMDPDPPTIPPEAPISEAVYDYFLRPGIRSLPVCSGDRLVGIFSLSDVRGVPRERWGSISVGEEMTPMPLKQVGPEDDLSHAVELLGRHSVHQLPVLEGGRLVGLLSRAHIILHFHSREELSLG